MRGRAPWWALVPLLLVAAPGLWAVGYRAVHGLGTTNLTNAVVWGLWVALYIEFIGLSAGIYLVTTLPYVFRVRLFEPIGPAALFTALVSLFTGLTFILLDLGHMERFVTVYTHPQAWSPLSWEIFAYAAYIGVLVCQLWLLVRADLVRLSSETGGALRWLYRALALFTTDLSDAALARDRRWVERVALVGLPVALSVRIGTGAIFAVAKARPFWFSSAVPFGFVVGAIASGAGLLAAVWWATGDRRAPGWEARVRALGAIAVGMVAIDLLLLGSDVLVGTYSHVAEELALYRAMLTGPFAWVFWIWQVALGSVVPIVMFGRGGRGPVVNATAGALVLLGSVAWRLTIVIPSLTVPVLPGLDAVVADARASYFYFPSWVECLSSLGLVAAAAAAWIVGAALLPLRPRSG